MYDGTREVVGVFDTAESLEHAAEELMSSGFDRARLSLLGTEQAVIARYGRRTLRVQELGDDPGAPRISYIDHHNLALGQAALVAGAVYLTGGLVTLASLGSGWTLKPAVALGVAAALVAGTIAFMLARALGLVTARKIASELARGGVILWVSTPEPRDEQRAIAILSGRGARDVHGHSRRWQAGMANNAGGVSQLQATPKGVRKDA